MKEKFSAFYRHSSEEDLKKIWKDKKTLFIFDTNILLSIYSYNKQGKDFFFNVLESLKGRVWLPFHVGLEYQRNRVRIIKKATSDFESLKSRVNDFQDRLNVDKNKIEAIQNDYHNIFKQHENFTKDYDEFINNYIDFMSDSQKKLIEMTEKLFLKIEKIDIESMSINGCDNIREKLDNIFTNDKIGDCLFKNESDIEKLNKEADVRYENKIPPGFADEKIKGDTSFIYSGIKYFRKYGDLIIFKELIGKSKSDGDKYDNFIFITDDSKQDWIETVTINNEVIKIGVLHSLKEEILRDSGIKNFMIFDQESFVKNTNNFILSGAEDDKFNNLISNIKFNFNEVNLIGDDKVYHSNQDINVSRFIDKYSLSKPQVIKSKDNTYRDSQTSMKISLYIARARLFGYYGNDELKKLCEYRDNIFVQIVDYENNVSSIKNKMFEFDVEESFAKNLAANNANEIFIQEIDKYQKLLKASRKALAEIDSMILEKMESSEG